MFHAISKMRPVSLRKRLESDLGFAEHDHRKEILGFMIHAVTLAVAFQLIENESPQSKEQGLQFDKTKRSGNVTGKAGPQHLRSIKCKAEELPLFSYAPQ